MRDDPSSAREDRLARGVDELNADNCFAAHEIWEDLWAETVEPEKRFLQGLVQIAAGYLKAESGLRSGALKLLRRGVSLLTEYGPTMCGLALVPWIAQINAALRTFIYNPVTSSPTGAPPRWTQDDTTVPTVCIASPAESRPPRRVPSVTRPSVTERNLRLPPD